MTGCPVALGFVSCIDTSFNRLNLACDVVFHLKRLDSLKASGMDAANVEHRLDHIEGLAIES